MDADLKALERAVRAESTDASLRSRFIRAGMRVGTQVIWRGGKDFDLISSGDLVNKYFTPPAAQIQRVATLNEQLHLGLTGEDFVRAWETIPAWPQQPTVGLVLAWYLPMVQETFESGWRAIQATHSHHWRWGWHKSHPRNLRLLSGIQHPEPGLRWEKIDFFANWDEENGIAPRALSGIQHPEPGLRWEKIDFFANWDEENGIAPRDVRNPETSPHAGLLAAAALHPALVTSMDGETVPYWWLSGYECGGGPGWRSVPWLSFDQGNRRILLSHNDYVNRNYAVPARFGE